LSEEGRRGEEEGDKYTVHTSTRQYTSESNTA
jgi:hypothetical protein